MFGDTIGDRGGTIRKDRPAAGRARRNIRRADVRHLFSSFGLRMRGALGGLVGLACVAILAGIVDHPGIVCSWGLLAGVVWLAAR